MVSETLLSSAVACVKALQKNTDIAADVFRDPQNTSLASALTLIAQLAQFVEHRVNFNGSMHNISMFIACRIRTAEEPSTSDPTFLLWNTMAADQTKENDRPAEQNHISGAISVHDNPNSWKRGHPTYSAPSSGPSNPTEFPQPPNVPLNTKPPSQSPNVSSDRYLVPIDVASECLQLLLDGSGFSTHKNMFQVGSYSALGSKTLVEVVQKVFDAERKKRTCNASSISGSSSTISGNNKLDDMIYYDLLPDYLRAKEGAGETIAAVPEVSLSPNGDPIISKMMKVVMNIRKPDRNRKGQNFAILCTLLHHTGPLGTCARVMKKYAQEGFTENGCKRRKRFSTSSRSHCSGSHSCLPDRTTLCSFHIASDSKPVGQGIVDPFSTTMSGLRIPEGSIMVRFGSLVNFESITFPADVTTEQRKEMYSSWKTSRELWKRELVERVDLLGEYNRTIGTAILVQNLIPKGAHESILKRASRNTVSSRQSVTDVANAIVVCDVVLNGDSNEGYGSVPYPYMEWYNLPSLKMLRSSHFDEMEPPQTLDSTVLKNAKALLWSKKKYKPRFQ